MTGSIKILVKCPACGKSLMNPDVRIDDLPSIDIETKIGKKVGHLYLSQVYGSYNKNFDGVDDIDGVICSLFCPHCGNPFPVYQTCECKAPIVGFQLQVGGTIKVCSRNGCKNHSLEFTNVNDAFELFQSQNKTGLS
ncbi:MAG: hypothetical protein U9R20_02560 [Thermodesulfobacteriota bacterium]|nr:hypothetical protein [Thermodesulfobacteriota bacterium]